MFKLTSHYLYHTFLNKASDIITVNWNSRIFVRIVECYVHTVLYAPKILKCGMNMHVCIQLEGQNALGYRWSSHNWQNRTRANTSWSQHLDRSTSQISTQRISCSIHIETRQTMMSRVPLVPVDMLLDDSMSSFRWNGETNKYLTFELGRAETIQKTYNHTKISIRSEKSKMNGIIRIEVDCSE